MKPFGLQALSRKLLWLAARLMASSAVAQQLNIFDSAEDTEPLSGKR